MGGAGARARARMATASRESWPYAACLLLALGAAWLAAAHPALRAAALLAVPLCLLGLWLNLRAAHAARRLQYQQAHDTVTGLLNRPEFEQRVARCVRAAPQPGSSPRDALLFLDLDQFRVVNHSCGHAAGDALLRQVAERIERSLRGRDAVSRLGGDEFGVLLCGCGAEDAVRIAEMLRQSLVELRFDHGGRSFPVSASIGVVELDGSWREASGVLSAAEEACSLAKEHGRNRVHLHRTGDAELEQREGMLQWVARIQDALDRDRLRLYAQVIAPAVPRDDAPRHVELLLRMLGAEGELISPMAFLPAAERFSMSTAIDRWVVGQAFEQLGAAGEGGPALCAINLSAASLSDERFLKFVLEQCERHGVEPSRVCFEITETAVISHFRKALGFIEGLRALGFRFSLDDFGTGMSSFAYLKQLPVDFLKIDGSFVKDMLDDPIDRAMVEAIHHVGHVMGIRTVAEFVEHDATRKCLQEIGVDYVQGYGIGKPAPFL